MTKRYAGASLVPMVGVAAMMVAAGVYTVSAERAGPAMETARSGQGISSSVVLALGDRVKLTFFEMVDIPTDRGKGVAGAIPSFFQRMDLTGEYAVDGDGAITVPRLGRHHVVGRTLAEVQTQLGLAFTRTMGHAAEIAVSVVERAPVYVVGPVRSPGAFKHTPGMLVLHAVALAGGVETRADGTSLIIEGVREAERLRKSSDQLKRLIARRARLEAERQGFEQVKAPAQLIALVGNKGAEDLLEAEQAILDVERRKLQYQQAEYTAGIAAARSEIASLRGSFAQFEAQRALRTDRLADLEQLMAQGHIKRHQVITVKSEIADIEVRKREVEAAIAQAEVRLAQLEGARARHGIDVAGTLLARIATTDDEIDDARQALRSTETLTKLMDRAGGNLEKVLSERAITYEIVRQTPAGPVTTAATETTQLLPGDILKIAVKSGVSAGTQATGGGRRAALEANGGDVR
jgi:exopolysaccharide production protein ExoF